MLFSERIGAKPREIQFQSDGMDDALRNGIWSSARITFLSTEDDDYESITNRILKITKLLFLRFFKRPIDTVPDTYSDCIDVIREWYFEAQWYEVYDFVEACLSILDWLRVDHETFSEWINAHLKREMSAYRLLEGRLVPITSESEIKAIEQAATQPEKFAAAAELIKAAISLFSNRKNPDHRNVIKESISAVEAVARIISGNPKATLGDALKAVAQQHPVHQVLKEGLLKIYGYTSDEGGIRHSMTEAQTVEASDAYFMLVTCSAFCNYLIAKSIPAT